MLTLGFFVWIVAGMALGHAMDSDSRRRSLMWVACAVVVLVAFGVTVLFCAGAGTSGPNVRVQR